MGKRGDKEQQQKQKKRAHEDDEGGDHDVHQDDKMDTSTASDTNNNTSKAKMNDKTVKKEPVALDQEDDDDEEEEDDDDDDDDDQDDEEDEEVEEEEIEEEVDEEEEADEEEEDNHNESATSDSKQNNANQKNKSQQNKSSSASSNNANQDKRPRLSDELYEINLRRKTEHVGSALYIPFPRKVTEEEVRAFVGQGPNIFLVGLQKLNAIVRYRTHEECEKQLQALRKKEFEGQTINIEPKTVKIDPANIDVKTLIVQYSNPNLNILDFAQVFTTASSISLKGSKGKKDGQEDLSFGSAIVVFTTHDEAKDAFLETENLNIKGENLRVVFADFRPNAGQPSRLGGGGGNFQFRKDNNRGGNFNRGGNQGGGRPQEGNFNRGPRRGGGGGNRGGGQRFGNRNFNQNPGGFNQNRNFTPNKKFRSNMPQSNFH